MSSFLDTSGNMSEAGTSHAKVYMVYSKRWIVLTVCCLVALSNAMLWISYATIPEQCNIFYCEGGKDCGAAFWTNQIFQIVAALTGLGGMYITDKYGIRPALLACVLVNLLGTVIRAVSAFPEMEDLFLRRVLLYVGSILAASAQAFYLVLPAKIAECWFAENQRALANVLSFIANPLGVAFGTLVPLFYFDAAHIDSFTPQSFLLFRYNVIMTILAILPAILAVFLPPSCPPTPPSPANETRAGQAPTFGKALVICLTNKQFLLQMYTFSMGFALFWTYMMVLPNVLAIKGYEYAPHIMALAAIVSSVFAIVAGDIADDIKKFKEMMKIFASGVFVFAFLNRIFLIFNHRTYWDDAALALLVIILGIFSIPQFPIGSEMGVETTYPVLEATSSGVLVLSGHVGMFILYFIVESSKTIPKLYDFDPTKLAGNWNLVLDIWVVIAGITAAVTVFFLNPEYKRMNADKDDESRSTSAERA